MRSNNCANASNSNVISNGKAENSNQQDHSSKMCTVKIGKEGDFSKVGTFLCYRNEYKVVNISYGPCLKRICVKRIRRAIGKWSQCANQNDSTSVNLYISMPQIDLIQMTGLCKLVQKQAKLKRDFQIYIEKQEQKQWSVNSLALNFNYNEDSIYFYTFDQKSQQIGHKFLRQFWYKYFGQTSAFDYQQLLFQLTKLQPLFQRFDKKKESYYPNPTDLWDYFYRGLITLTKSAFTLQELEIEYEICGYEEDDNFNNKILEQLSTLQSLQKFSLVYKLKDGLQRKGIIPENELALGMQGMRSAVSCAIKRGPKQMEKVSLRVVHGSTKLSTIELKKSQNNLSKNWGSAFMEFKECAGRAEWIGGMTNILKMAVLREVEQLKISIERISGEQCLKKEDGGGVYEMLFALLLENIRLKDCLLFIREDSFHFRLRKKLGVFKTKYVDSDNIASLQFSCSERLGGLRLVFHFLHSLFTRSSQAAHMKNKWLLLQPQRIDALLKAQQSNLQNKGDESGIAKHIEDSFINSLELDEKNPGELIPIKIQKSIRKPSSFTMGEDKIEEEDQINETKQYSQDLQEFQDTHSEIMKKNNLKVPPEGDISLVSEKSSRDSTSSKKLGKSSTIEITSSWLTECVLEVECIDSFERYSEFLEDSLCQLLNENTQKLSIIIKDNNYAEKTHSRGVLIQEVYQKVFQKILSRFHSWPEQSIVLSIYSKKINQYAIQLQKNYFQICNVRAYELVNIEMNISCSENNDQRNEINQNRDAIAKQKQRQQANKMEGRQKSGQNRNQNQTQKTSHSSKDKLNKNSKTKNSNEINKLCGKQNQQQYIQIKKFPKNNNQIQKLDVTPHQDKVMFELVRKMNIHLVNGENQDFKTRLQQAVDYLRGRVLELHCQYHSVENEQYKDSVLGSLMHLNTESVRCVYANVYQQKQPSNINRHFFTWLDLLLAHRFHHDHKSYFHQNEIVIHFHVQDVQLAFSSSRKMKILKWMTSNSSHCDYELLRVLESNFGQNILFISSLPSFSDQYQQQQIHQENNQPTEEFEICSKNSLAKIRVRGAQQANPKNNNNLQVQQSDNNLKPGLCLLFYRVYQKIKKIHLTVNPKQSTLQIKLATTFAKLKQLEDLQIYFELNSKATWEEYTILEHLGDVTSKMIQIFVEDDEKDFKFLDQAKRIFHNLLGITNLITLQITVKGNEDPANVNSKYKLRHFEFLSPFLYIPPKLVNLKLISPHKHINSQFNYGRRKLLILSIEALRKKKLYRKEILMEIIDYHVCDPPTKALSN